jgi:poly(hydroxyalkanoate) depolymerase family esterase
MKIILALFTALTTATTAMAQTSGQFLWRDITTSSGARRYKVFVPSTYDGSRALPLVVMLHGCTQDPEDVARGTRLNSVAESKSVIVVYPEQADAFNPKKCWNWYDAAHQKRDAGEPDIIAGITREVMKTYKVDPNRVYIGGLSAGAAMASIVAFAYPDVFAAAAFHSGIPYGAATNVMEGLAAMQGAKKDADSLAAKAKALMGGRTRTIPSIIFQGKSDHVVNVANADQLALQMTALAESMPSSKGTDNPGIAADYHYTRSVRANGVVEVWTIDELGHAWSGGSKEGTFTDEHGPNAAAEMMRFFLEHPMGH